MTNRSDLFWTYLSPPLFGVFRAAIGTPIDVVATKEITLQKTTLQILKETPWSHYRKGFQPNALKFFFRTPAQFFFTWSISSIVPNDIPPALRGLCLGFLINGAEAGFFNIFNAARTRFIQGDGWKDLTRDVFTKGLTAAWSHRAASSALFYAFYEPLKKEYPAHTMAVSTAAGVAQVILTAPFYIAMIERQKKGAPPETLYKTLLRLFTTQRFLVPALAPRLFHTIVITGPFMKLMDDKLKLIQR